MFADAAGSCSYDHLVTESDDNEQNGSEPLLEWEAPRFLFWPVAILGVLFALLALVVGSSSSFALLVLVCFQTAWGILRGAGRLKNWKVAQRIVSSILWVAWIAVFVGYATTRGWL